MKHPLVPAAVTLLATPAAHAETIDMDIASRCVTEEGYPLSALRQRSHPMGERLSAGDTVRVAALRGTVLPDPLGAKVPEYFQ